MLSVVIEAKTKQIEVKKSIILNSIQPCFLFSEKKALEMSMDIMGEGISIKGIK